MKDRRPIIVPQFEELPTKKIYLKIKHFCPGTVLYFPEYEDSKEFFPPEEIYMECVQHP